MTLKEYCQTLSKNDLFELALRICENAMPIWDSFSATNELGYMDTVIGLHHKVRPELLRDSLIFCREDTPDKLVTDNRLNNLLDEFEDPIVAIQDSDWELPDNVEKVFHAVYNLLKGLKSPNAFGELVHHIAVNKAADALHSSELMTVDQIKKLIYNP